MATNDKLTAENASLVAASNALRAANAKLEAEKSVLAPTLASLRAANAALVGEKAALRASAGAVGRERAALEAESAALAADKASLSASLASSRSRCAELSRELSAAARRAGELEARLAAVLHAAGAPVAPPEADARWDEVSGLPQGAAAAEGAVESHANTRTTAQHRKRPRPDKGHSRASPPACSALEAAAATEGEEEPLPPPVSPLRGGDDAPLPPPVSPLRPPPAVALPPRASAKAVGVVAKKRRAVPRARAPPPPPPPPPDGVAGRTGARALGSIGPSTLATAVRSFMRPGGEAAGVAAAAAPPLPQHHAAPHFGLSDCTEVGVASLLTACGECPGWGEPRRDGSYPPPPHDCPASAALAALGDALSPRLRSVTPASLLRGCLGALRGCSGAASRARIAAAVACLDDVLSRHGASTPRLIGGGIPGGLVGALVAPLRLAGVGVCESHAAAAPPHPPSAAAAACLLRLSPSGGVPALRVLLLDCLLLGGCERGAASARAAASAWPHALSSAPRRDPLLRAVTCCLADGVEDGDAAAMGCDPKLLEDGIQGAATSALESLMQHCGGCEEPRWLRDGVFCAGLALELCGARLGWDLSWDLWGRALVASASQEALHADHPAPGVLAHLILLGLADPHGSGGDSLADARRSLCAAVPRCDSAPAAAARVHAAVGEEATPEGAALVAWWSHLSAQQRGALHARTRQALAAVGLT